MLIKITNRDYEDAGFSRTEIFTADYFKLSTIQYGNTKGGYYSKCFTRNDENDKGTIICPPATIEVYDSGFMIHHFVIEQPTTETKE